MRRYPISFVVCTVLAFLASAVALVGSGLFPLVIARLRAAEATHAGRD